MAWMNTITGRMANDANRFFPQGLGRGFQTVDRNPLVSGVMGGIGRMLGPTSGLPAGTTLPTGSTAGRTGGPGGLMGGFGGALGMLGSGTGPQAPTPGFQPPIQTPGGAGLGPTGAPGTLPTTTNAPPQGLMAALAGLMGGGGGASPGSAVPSGLGAQGAVGGIAGLLGGSNPIMGGGLGSLLAALQNANRGPGQQSHGTPT